MTVIAIGASASLTVGDGGYISIATNGGMGSFTVTTGLGVTRTENFGPLAHRRIHGPYREGAVGVLSNISCASMEIDGTSIIPQTGVSPVAPLLSGTRGLRKAIDSVKTGSAAAGPILIVGDSTDRGANGVHTQSWPYFLAQALNASGIPTSIDSVFGASNFGASASAFTAADPRVVFGAGWAINNNIRSAGGGEFEFPANTTPTAMAFTPGSSYNQVDIYYYQNGGAGLGTFTVDRGGVAPSSGSPVNANTSPQAIAKVTLNWGTTAAGALNIQTPNNTSPKIRIVGIVCRNTASPTLELINAAWAGSSSQDWISGPGVQLGLWGPIAAVQAINPLAILWGHEVNDFNGGLSSGNNNSPIDIPTHLANLSTYLGLVQSGGGMVMLRKAQSDPGSFASLATQEAYWTADKLFAAQNNIPTIDMQYVCGDYPTAVADGLALDQRHYNAAGYQRGARLVARFFQSL